MNTRTVNTRPQLIARFEAASVATSERGAGGAIKVYLFETVGDPFFQLLADGGFLPDGIDGHKYKTAARALRVASELCLTMIYDEVEEITEAGGGEETDQDDSEVGDDAKGDAECTDVDATA